MAQQSGGPADVPLAMIVALARNRVIGADQGLPWRLPEDLRHFRRLTLGHTVVMGRKTWESLPRALDGRQNVVITRQPGYVALGAEVVDSLPAALARATMPPPICCIGGGEIFRIALPLATVVHATEIDCDFAGDTTFPALDPTVWREASREMHVAPAPAGYDYAFVTYVRRDAAHGGS
jgi:dihydrofolate reductase